MPRKTKLSMDKLSSGIEYFTGVSATLVVIFTDTNNQFTLFNFLSKYQDELGIALKMILTRRIMMVGYYIPSKVQKKILIEYVL